MTIEELEKDLKNNILNPIYLLYGEETFLLESSYKKIVKLFGDIVLGINYIKIDENVGEGVASSLISNIETPSFGYEKKLIIVKNSGLFKKTAGANLSEYISNNIENIKDSNVIVFIEDKPEKVELLKTIDKYGIICEFQSQKPMQIIQRLKQICNAYKVSVTDADLNYLISVCGTNMQDLINEIRKLIEYAGENGSIKKQDIDMLCIRQIDAVIFDLTNALGNKKIKEGLNIINDLIYIKEPVQRIIFTLYNHFKKLYLTKLAIRYNKDIASSLELKPNQLFLVSKYKTQSGYFEEGTLRKILEELTDLDANYKVGLIDVNVGLEAILCRYC